MPRDLCRVCRHRLDPVVDPTHPGCAPGPVLSADDEARVLALLARQLGAVEIEAHR